MNALNSPTAQLVGALLRGRRHRRVLDRGDTGSAAITGSLVLGFVCSCTSAAAAASPFR